jgi:hypothetical protein
MFVGGVLAVFGIVAWKNGLTPREREAIGRYLPRRRRDVPRQDAQLLGPNGESEPAA